MSKIRLTTITPVHIGSGTILRHNIDFVEESIDEDNYLGVVDPNRLFNIIGPERMDSWIAAIERGDNIKEFVDRLSKKSIEEYSSRLIYCPQTLNLKPNEEMREYIHDGLGNPYIPGSSLKGAIRTAILAYLVDKKKINVSTKVQVSEEEKNGRKKYKATSNIEKELFGNDPNTDCFRFLQVGDAFFDYGCEDVLKMSNLNIREANSFEDFSKQQLAEVVTTGEQSHVFNLKLSETPTLTELIRDYNNNAKSWNEDPRNIKKKDLIKSLGISDVRSLFAILNDHTKQLLMDELEFWNQDYGKDGVDKYLDAINQVVAATDECKKDECILRVGHASGWRFITGAWTERVNDDKWDGLVNAARPRNSRYREYPFPKSRRVNNTKDEITLLGFVKLSIVEP